MMALNRYRLRHLEQSGHRAAILVSRLLKRPDRMLGVILLGNNIANLLASAISTVLALKIFSQYGLESYAMSAVGVSVLPLTIVILIFAEVAPKTMAALHPERVAFPAAYILYPLLIVTYPIVMMVNAIANMFLRLFGVSIHSNTIQLSPEELRVAVMETGGLLPKTHRSMLLGILDLGGIAVDDVMVPRGKIEGIDIDADWDDIIEQITNSRFTRLPVYHGSLDNVIGTVHVRRVLNTMREGRLDRKSFMSIITEPYFIPKGTPLNTQLINFKYNKRRRGLVVDEYGDIMGLVTLEEILEEIIGDFTTQAYDRGVEAQRQKDGSYLVKGSANLRDLNRKLNWHLPIGECRTINGLITEYLEDIPEPDTSLMVDNYQIDIVRTKGTAVEVARIRPITSETAQSETQADH